MTKDEDEVICCLCNSKCVIGNVMDFSNDYEEDERELILCNKCYFSGKCDECDKYMEDKNELFYLIDNYNNIDICVICLLEQTKLKNKSTFIKEILDEIGLKDMSELKEIIDFYKKYKDDFLRYVNKNQNNISNINKPSLSTKNNFNNIDSEFIKVENEKIDNSLESKINEALDKQNIIFNKYKQEQELKYNELNNNFIKLKTEKDINKLTPTPSSSGDKKEKNKVNKKTNEKLLLPENINEVIYYRKIVFDKFNSCYFKNNNKYYLSCCGQYYKEKEISNVINITCNKCYKTYHLSENCNKINNIYDIIEEILPEHIIENESEIYNKIKCNNNNCNYISKKEIDLCHKCKNIEKCEIVEYPLPDINDEGYETKLALAGKCYNGISYTSGIYDKAHKEGLVKNGFKALTDYVKKNKLMEERQVNVIKNKIIRCYYILKLYNEDKYSNIQNYIKRLDFSLNSIAKLSDDDFLAFQYELTEKLNKELENPKQDINDKIKILVYDENKSNIDYPILLSKDIISKQDINENNNEIDK